MKDWVQCALLLVVFLLHPVLLASLLSEIPCGHSTCFMDQGEYCHFKASYGTCLIAETCHGMSYDNRKACEKTVNYLHDIKDIDVALPVENLDSGETSTLSHGADDATKTQFPIFGIIVLVLALAVIITLSITVTFIVKRQRERKRPDQISSSDITNPNMEECESLMDVEVHSVESTSNAPNITPNPVFNNSQSSPWRLASKQTTEDHPPLDRPHLQVDDAHNDDTVHDIH